MRGPLQPFSELSARGVCLTLLFLGSLCGCQPSSNRNQNSQMQNPVNYFEIPVSDLPRAVKFYESVFQCKLDIKNIDGNQMAIFPGNVDGPGIFGALAFGPTYKPSIDGTRIYFSTKSIDAVLKQVIQNGGRVEYPKTEVADIGFVAEFIDSEGNRIALHEPRVP